MSATSLPRPGNIVPVNFRAPLPLLPMNLEKITSLKESTQNSNSSRSRRLPAVLLPVGLLIAFVAVFGLMFGSRLLPATEVTTASVIALRLNPDQSTNQKPGN